MKQIKGPCLCGAYDCPRCYPFEHNMPYDDEERDVSDDEIHGVDRVERQERERGDE